MFWPTGVPVTATSTSRPRQARITRSSSTPNPRFDLTNDLVELSLLMYYGETEPYLALLKDCGRDGRSTHPEPDLADALELNYHSFRKSGKERVLTPLDVLTSPLREAEIVDSWSPYEVAVFEASLCKFGESRWAEVARFLPRKSPEDVKTFFVQIYSKTKRYSALKDAVGKNSTPL